MRRKKVASLNEVCHANTYFIRLTLLETSCITSERKKCSLSSLTGSRFFFLLLLSLILSVTRLKWTSKWTEPARQTGKEKACQVYSQPVAKQGRSRKRERGWKRKYSSERGAACPGHLWRASHLIPHPSHLFRLSEVASRGKMWSFSCSLSSSGARERIQSGWRKLQQAKGEEEMFLQRTVARVDRKEWISGEISRARGGVCVRCFPGDLLLCQETTCSWSSVFSSQAASVAVSCSFGGRMQAKEKLALVPLGISHQENKLKWNLWLILTNYTRVNCNLSIWSGVMQARTLL